MILTQDLLRAKCCRSENWVEMEYHTCTKVMHDIYCNAYNNTHVSGLSNGNDVSCWRCLHEQHVWSIERSDM